MSVLNTAERKRLVDGINSVIGQLRDICCFAEYCEAPADFDARPEVIAARDAVIKLSELPLGEQS